MTQYEGVIFDFDGVILNSAHDGFKWADEVREQKAQEFGKEYDGPYEGFLFSASSYEEMMALVEKSSFTWKEAFAIEKAVAREKLELVRAGKMGMYPDAEKALNSIGSRKSVVSNAYGDITDSIIRSLGITSYLDYWTAPRLDSIEMYHSIWKPETYMLDFVMNSMGIQDVLMVGDSWFDIKAAENAGIDSVLIERPHNSNCGADPDYRVSSLTELGDLVGTSQD